MFKMLFRLFIKLQVAIFRRSNGKSMSFLNGMPVLLLNTIGRKSKKQRTTPVMYIRDGENYVITASNSGNDHAPAWFYNLQADPRVTIEVPGKQLQVIAFHRSTGGENPSLGTAYWLRLRFSMVIANRRHGRFR